MKQRFATFPSRPLIGIIYLSVLPILTLCPPAKAQEVVAISEIPPYAVQQSDGSWSGPAVDLFRAAADQVAMDYQFVSVENSANAAASFPTYATVQPSGFYETLPFHIDSVGLVGMSATGRFLERLSGLFTFGLLWAALVVGALVLVAGMAFWLAERNGNENISPEGGKLKGIGQGFWWAGVTATTIGYGDTVPRTLPGRIVAMIWMLFAMALTALLTAYLVSLTGGQGVGSNLADAISGKRVGLVENSPVLPDDLSKAETVLRFPTMDAALRALDAQQIDAVAFPYTPAKAMAGDRPVRKTEGSVAMPIFEVRSPELRNELNRIILSAYWQERLGKEWDTK